MNDTQSITVNGTERTYDKTWDQEFRKEIAEGNTSVRKAPLPGGNSILKISHNETKGVERHTIFVRDKILAEMGTEQEQVTVIGTHKADDPASEARLLLLIDGIATKLQEEGFASDVVAGQM